MPKERQIIIQIISGNRFRHDTILSREIPHNGTFKKMGKRDEHDDSSTSPC